MSCKTLSLAAVIACSLAAVPVSVLAMGSDTSSDSNEPEKPTCKSGYVYSEKKKRCVREDTGILERSDLIRHAWQKAYAGDYHEARAVFASLANEPSAEIYNGLGYSNRKLGAVETGIAYHRKALPLEPEYVLARSYLSEGYVQSGKLDLAREQLAQIGERCGKGCKEYLYLLRAIELGGPNDW